MWSAASIELIVDPNAGHTHRAGRERDAAPRAGPTGGIRGHVGITTSQLRDESAGPHVVQVSSSTANGVTTLQVSFDSDLNPDTVAGAISVLSASGATLPSTAVYNADTRTATVTIANAPAGTLTLDIATTLADVNGQTLAQQLHDQGRADS